MRRVDVFSNFDWREGAFVRPVPFWRRDGKDRRRNAIIKPFGKPGGQILDLQLGNGFHLKNVLTEVARHYLEKAMTESNGNKSEAARLVGFSNYQPLGNWLKKYGIDKEAS